MPSARTDAAVEDVNSTNNQNLLGRYLQIRSAVASVA